MSLLATIESAVVAAMREKKEPDLSMLRIVKTAIKNREIELRAQGKELTDEETLKVVKSQAKQLKDARAEFEQAGRTDLVEKSNAELAVVERFLPQELTDDEIRGIIRNVLATTANPSMGTCMGAVMQRIAGRADGGRVRDILQQELP